jgi:hypothetical protein
MYQLWTLNCAETEAAAARRKAQTEIERILNLYICIVEGKGGFFFEYC